MKSTDSPSGLGGPTLPAADPRRWRILAVLSVALFMAMLDVSIVTVALPSIQSGIGATESDIQWVVAGYALTFGVLQVASGRAGDLFGRGGLFIIGAAGFAAASVLAGLADAPLMLNFARAAQGLGAGLVLPQVVGMIQQFFSGPERGRAFGIFGGVVGVAVAIGPTFGGFLIHLFGHPDGWRSVFFINLPVGVVAILLAVLWFPKPLLSGRADTSANLARDLDPVGTVLLGLAVLGILLPFVESGASVLAWVALPIGLVLLVGWVAWERRYKRNGHSPMVDLDIFRAPSFRNGTLLLALYFFGTSSIWIILNLYFQQGLGHSPLEAGLLGLPSAMSTGVVAVWAGRLVGRYGRAVVIAGIWVALTGLAGSMLVVYLNHAGVASEWWLWPTLAIFGIGGGAVISPNQALTLEEVPLEYAGASGGVMQTAQQVGISVGLAVVTAISFSALSVSDWPTAFLVGLGVITVPLAAAQVVAYVDARRRHVPAVVQSR